MAFAATLVDSTQPRYVGGRKQERWTATQLATDTGGTITSRYLDRVDRAQVDPTGPASAVTGFTKSVSGRVLTIVTSGTTSPTAFDVILEQDT